MPVFIDFYIPMCKDCVSGAAAKWHTSRKKIPIQKPVERASDSQPDDSGCGITLLRYRGDVKLHPMQGTMVKLPLYGHPQKPVFAARRTNRSRQSGMLNLSWKPLPSVWGQAAPSATETGPKEGNKHGSGKTRGRP